MQCLGRTNLRALRTFRNIDAEIAFMGDTNGLANCQRPQFGLSDRSGNNLHGTERTGQHTRLTTDAALFNKLDGIFPVNQRIGRTHIDTRCIFAMMALNGCRHGQPLDHFQSGMKVFWRQIVFCASRMRQHTCDLTGAASNTLIGFCNHKPVHSSVSCLSGHSG